MNSRGCNSHKQSKINHVSVKEIDISIFCFIGFLVCVYLGLIGCFIKIGNTTNTQTNTKYKHMHKMQGKRRTKAQKLKDNSNTTPWSHNSKTRTYETTL